MTNLQPTGFRCDRGFVKRKFVEPQGAGIFVMTKRVLCGRLHLRPSQGAPHRTTGVRASLGARHLSQTV